VLTATVTYETKDLYGKIEAKREIKVAKSEEPKEEKKTEKKKKEKKPEA
jgi:hypothetical protein